MIILSILTISSFAKMPTGFKFDETDKAKIQQWIANNSTCDSFEKNRLQIMLLVADMDAKKTSYTAFKKAIIDFTNSKDFIKSKDVSTTNSAKLYIVFMVVNTKRFVPYFAQVLKDTSLSDSKYLAGTFALTKFQKYFLVNKETFRTYFIKGIKQVTSYKTKVIKKKIKKAMAILDFYKSSIKILGLTKEEIDQDLREADFEIRPKLSENAEAWKPVAAKLVLLKQANQ